MAIKLDRTIPFIHFFYYMPSLEKHLVQEYFMGLKSWIASTGANLVYGSLSKVLWPRASAAAFVIKDEKLLAIDTGSYLMLPGGGLEYGESFDEAARRETSEETGYRIQVKNKLGEGINSVGGTEMFYEAELMKDERSHSGSWEGKTVWIDLEDIDSRRWRHKRDVKTILESQNDL